MASDQQHSDPEKGGEGIKVGVDVTLVWPNEIGVFFDGRAWSAIGRGKFMYMPYPPLIGMTIIPEGCDGLNDITIVSVRWHEGCDFFIAECEEINMCKAESANEVIAELDYFYERGWGDETIEQNERGVFESMRKHLRQKLACLREDGQGDSSDDR